MGGGWLELRWRGSLLVFWRGSRFRCSSLMSTRRRSQRLIIRRLIFIEIDSMRPCFLKWSVMIFLNRSVCGPDAFFRRVSPSSLYGDRCFCY